MSVVLDAHAAVWYLLGDMPDRIMAATALPLGLPLATRDRRIQSAGIQTVW